MGGLGEGYSSNPCTHSGMDPAAGNRLCLLFIIGCLSAVFIPSGHGGVCFWGRSVQ